MSALPDRCHFIYPEDGLVAFIPGCMATVHGDREACTCNITGSQLEQAIAAKEDAEEEAESLHQSLSYYQQEHSKMCKRANDLRRRNYELERMLK